MKISFIIPFLFVNLVICQDTGYSDSFINIGASSRSIGLAQAVVALPANIGGYSVNAASTANVDKNMINGLYINQFDMAEYYSFGINYPTASKYKIGIYGLNFVVDNIFERPDINDITSLEARRDSIRTLVAQGYNSFNTRESAIFFNISRDYEKSFSRKQSNKTMLITIPIGLNIKLIQKDLYQTKGKGIGLDFGGMVIMDFNQFLKGDWLNQITFGFALTNIFNTTIYWDSDEKDSIPMQLIGGVGYAHEFNKLPIQYNLLWQKNSLYLEENQYGVEVIAFDIVSIRGGYYAEYLQGGLGLKVRINEYIVGVDYSFSDHDLGNAHRIGGWLSF